LGGLVWIGVSWGEYVDFVDWEGWGGLEWVGLSLLILMIGRVGVDWSELG